MKKFFLEYRQTNSEHRINTKKLMSGNKPISSSKDSISWIELKIN